MEIEDERHQHPNLFRSLEMEEERLYNEMATSSGGLPPNLTAASLAATVRSRAASSPCARPISPFSPASPRCMTCGSTQVAVNMPSQSPPPPSSLPKSGRSKDGFVKPSPPSPAGSGMAMSPRPVAFPQGGSMMKSGGATSPLPMDMSRNIDSEDDSKSFDGD